MMADGPMILTGYPTSKKARRPGGSLRSETAPKSLPNTWPPTCEACETCERSQWLEDSRKNEKMTVSPFFETHRILTVLLYMITWIPSHQSESIYPIYVSIYIYIIYIPAPWILWEIGLPEFEI